MELSSHYGFRKQRPLSDDSAIVGCVSEGKEEEYWGVGDSFRWAM